MFDKSLFWYGRTKSSRRPSILLKQFAIEEILVIYFTLSCDLNIFVQNGCNFVLVSHQNNVLVIKGYISFVCKRNELKSKIFNGRRNIFTVYLIFLCFVGVPSLNDMKAHT